MKTIFIANWKINIGFKGSEKLSLEYEKNLISVWDKAEIIVCPSHPFLLRAINIFDKTDISVGAQNIFWEEQGLYTGEVSILMIYEIGCSHIIVGHSERRKNFNESNEQINKKIKLVLKYKLIPIVCVGETFDQRHAGKKNLVIAKQLVESLKGIDFTKDQKIIIAYEPVWSISPGLPCEPQEAKDTSKLITQILLDIYPEDIIENNFDCIYGGSVDENNVKDYVDMKNFIGVLVGGASLKADKFSQIIKKIIRK